MECMERLRKEGCPPVLWPRYRPVFMFIQGPSNAFETWFAGRFARLPPDVELIVILPQHRRHVCVASQHVSSKSRSLEGTGPSHSIMRCIRRNEFAQYLAFFIFTTTQIALAHYLAICAKLDISLVSTENEVLGELHRLSGEKVRAAACCVLQKRSCPFEPVSLSLEGYALNFRLRHAHPSKSSSWETRDHKALQAASRNWRMDDLSALWWLAIGKVAVESST
ncbi:hypothetical protein BKA67DRAFT_534677 [Truncatella angustata]|uniref:Uncharacterized protein n=1 Tax=Truncatella angustata TaxID=152316 RepID=A0A9P8ZY79_9PEZI|nr:uncharacterized protein BKA67DRAFT_534677 [Truncatella angustata]KAH6655761.1 hypothetical protein BKA67DRAFT_534677 [Truncatella angustata]